MARPVPDQAAPGRLGLRRAWPSAAVIAAYLALALVAFWPGLSGISSHLLGGEGDFVEAVWFIAWIPHALLHGLNPFFSHYLNVPFGVNLGQNTEAPLLGLLGAPISLVFSPLVATNVLLLLGMPISATAAFVVLRKWQVWLPAAALGGLVYGFSPYMVGQSQGHPQLMFQPLAPLIALTLASILQGRGDPKWLGFGLGLLLAGQYFISPELFAIIAIFAVGAMICVAIRHPKNVPHLARVAALPFGIAFVVAAVLLAYPVWMLVAGPQHATGTTFPRSNAFHNDLLSFVVPGPLQRVSLGMHSLQRRILGYNNATEAGGYIGIPVLLVTAFLAWRSRRNSRTQLAVVLMIAAAVLSLGPYLIVNGRATTYRLPFLVFLHLPLLGNILPGRISFAVAAFVGAVIAFGLDDLHRTAARDHAGSGAARPRTWQRVSVVAAALTLVVVVVTQLPVWPYKTPAQSALPASLNRAIPAGEPVAITYPYDTASVTEPMFWQAMNGFTFRLIGAYAYIRGPNGEGTTLPVLMHPAGFQLFLAGQEGVAYYGPKVPVTTALIATTRATVARYHIRLVIVNRSLKGSGPVVSVLTEALGPPKATSGSLSLWADWPNAPKR